MWGYIFHPHNTICNLQFGQLKISKFDMLGLLQKVMGAWLGGLTFPLWTKTWYLNHYHHLPKHYG